MNEKWTWMIISGLVTVLEWGRMRDAHGTKVEWMDDGGGAMLCRVWHGYGNLIMVRVFEIYLRDRFELMPWWRAVWMNEVSDECLEVDGKGTRSTWAGRG